MGNAMKSTPVATRSENNASTPCLTSSEILVVIHDYPSANISEPIFRTGEKLKVLAEEGPWWKVCSVQTAVENYIPNDHIAKVYHGWLFEGVARQKAEELLRLPGNVVGSFMIRDSTKKRGDYSLSVRHRSVMHYRICRLPNNWYYISPRLTFQCLEELVDHYSDIADGLCCVLTTPCLALPANPGNLTSPEPTVVMRHHLDWSSVDRTQGNSQLSFGVRHSMADYLSLAGSEDAWQGKSNRKKKSKSIYVMPNYEFNSLSMEED
ncbi:src like adaptor 1a [Anguilla anguilla]|uniref:SH2 domain-containing protein n=1 Tax=Anguilla anguilla TaxID=7936 RepID=A0A0E9X545_ANGAN|nr:src like adaptor 1a [Anguilla anguilla]KAG5842652.1 hypothetical protein ANANG_G00179890 [Anguilla anguilla]